MSDGYARPSMPELGPLPSHPVRTVGKPDGQVHQAQGPLDDHVHPVFHAEVELVLNVAL